MKLGASPFRFLEYDPENRLTKVQYDDDQTGPTGLVTVAEYRYGNRNGHGLVLEGWEPVEYIQ